MQPLSLILRCPVLKDLHICPNLRKKQYVRRGTFALDVIFLIFLSGGEKSEGFFTFTPCGQFTRPLPRKHPVALEHKTGCFCPKMRDERFEEDWGWCEWAQGPQTSSAWFLLKRSWSLEFFLRTFILYWGPSGVQTDGGTAAYRAECITFSHMSPVSFCPVWLNSSLDTLHGHLKAARSQFSRSSWEKKVPLVGIIAFSTCSFPLRVHWEKV